ncbi:lysophospholipid acyltransferase family protein [Hamadaea tsunoensis]|uniref:lysophospholipid acyltransferase family protein n=1 Tax=Hamadaea tsunoensis TaxID=53368 RepID=UPI0004048068|nr:lysophospholipid acyltransferase family protein [Hamadaea tsunoensis]
MGAVRFAARLAGAFGVLLLFVIIPKRAALVQAVSRALLAVLGVKLRVRGKLRPGLLVANHISWADIVVLMALDGRVRLVAKTEVGRWPLIGSLARRRRAIFIDRSAPRALPGSVAQATAALRAGDTVAVFPEATTSCGFCPTPVRPAFFQAALDAGVAVTPVTLAFTTAGEPSSVAAFVGVDTLVSSIARIARSRGVELTVTVAGRLFPEVGADRRALARAAGAAFGTARTHRGRVSVIPTRDISRIPVPLAA